MDGDTGEEGGTDKAPKGKKKPRTSRWSDIIHSVYVTLISCVIHKTMSLEFELLCRLDM